MFASLLLSFHGQEIFKKKIVVPALLPPLSFHFTLHVSLQNCTIVEDKKKDFISKEPVLTFKRAYFDVQKCLFRILKV